MSQVWALLPIKGFSDAKQRLSSVLSAQQRRDLFAATVEDLLEQLSQVLNLAGVALVSNEPQAGQLAAKWDFVCLAEPAAVKGLNQAVQWGLDQLHALGASQALVLHGDLPLATAADIQVLSGLEASTVLVPDWRDEGSNGLLINLPSPITPAYGVGSFERHATMLSKAGVQFSALRQSTLAFDVDTAQDLAYLQALAAAGWVGPRSTAALAEFGLEQRLVTAGVNIVAAEFDLIKSRLGF